jgi:hypothetical protein
VARAIRPLSLPLGGWAATPRPARKSLLATRPASARGANMRTEGMAAFGAAERAAANLLEVVRLASPGKKFAKRIDALDAAFR